MPAGNDAQAAARELASRYPQASDASALITANRKRRSRDLIAASRKDVDEEATKELDLDAIAKRAKVSEVVDAAVRGRTVIFIYVGADDALHKGKINRVGRSVKSGSKSASRPSKRSQRAKAKSSEDAPSGSSSSRSGSGSGDSKSE